MCFLYQAGPPTPDSHSVRSAFGKPRGVLVPGYLSERDLAPPTGGREDRNPVGVCVSGDCTLEAPGPNQHVDQAKKYERTRTSGGGWLAGKRNVCAFNSQKNEIVCGF